MIAALLRPAHGLCAIVVWLALGGIARSAEPATPAAPATPPAPQSVPLKQIHLSPTIFNSFVTQFTNSGWYSAHSSNAIFSFINELHLRPKVFHTDSGSDSGVFGFEYDFNKSIANRTLNADSINPLGLSFNLTAKGSVADHAAKNPDSFLESGAKLHLFQAIGGMTPQIIEDAATLDARQEIQQRMAAIEDPKSREMRRLERKLLEFARPQLAWDVAAHYTLESDQEFDNTQWTYGGQVTLAYQDFRSDTWYRWLNVLDYPFALIRVLTLPGEPAGPCAQAFPVLIGGVDLVDPGDNKARLAIDPSKDTYARFRGEAAFKTEIAELFGKDIWLSASYRYFQELDASTAIKNADLDEFSYFVARLDLPLGFSLSYSTGKLPLDRKNDSVYAIGWAATIP